MSWGDIGPYDFRYKPDSTSEIQWCCLPQVTRNAIAARSPAWQEDRNREAAEVAARRDAEILEFRAMFPLVDLDSVPRKSWMRWPGVRCDDRANLCPVRHNDPACQLRHRAQLFTVQAGICGWCGEPLPSNLERSDIDHVIPVSRRGPWVEWNYQLLHAGCNRSKGARLTDRAYALADEHGFVIPDFIAVWEQPVLARKIVRRPGERPVHRWRGATGPVHLVHPGDEGQTLCGYGYAGEWPRASGDGGKPWNATCDHCRERRLILGPGLAAAHPGLPY